MKEIADGLVVGQKQMLWTEKLAAKRKAGNRQMASFSSPLTSPADMQEFTTASLQCTITWYGLLWTEKLAAKRKAEKRRVSGFVDVFS